MKATVRDTWSFANCHMGENFKSYISKYIAELAKTGTDIVMLDDDFRMSQHGSELCCACPDHLRRMSEILGEEITADKIRPYVLSGKANQYRDAWLMANHDEVINALIDMNYKGYFTLECNSGLVPYKYWLYNRREFDRDKRLAEPQLFMRQKLEELLYDTAKYILDSYGLFEK